MDKINLPWEKVGFDSIDVLSAYYLGGSLWVFFHVSLYLWLIHKRGAVYLSYAQKKVKGFFTKILKKPITSGDFDVQAINHINLLIEFLLLFCDITIISTERTNLGLRPLAGVCGALCDPPFRGMLVGLLFLGSRSIRFGVGLHCQK